MTNVAWIFKRQLHREWMIHCRAPRQLIYACLFFIMMLVFFPLTLSAEPETLRTLAPGLIWIDLLFAFFLSSERLFQPDYEDGVIEQWLVSGYPISLLVMAKLSMHWCLNVIPMLLLCPLISLFLHLSPYEMMVLAWTLLAGSPALLFLSALAAAFSTGIKQKGILMALILFPLTIPIMIFGSSTLTSAMQLLPIQGYLAILLAFSLLCIAFLPWAIAGIIKNTLC